MDEVKVLEVLGQVEWVAVGPRQGLRYCPYCARWQSDGHRDDCKLDALLSEGEKEEEDG